MHRKPPRRSLPLVAAVATWSGLAAPGCLDREVAPVEPHTQSHIVERFTQGGAIKLDLLFVVDNSGSMNTEQLELGRRIEDMVRELVQPTERPDGRTPPPLDDLHVGVVSTDMGTGGHPVLGCRDAAVGDNGVLRSEARDPGCRELYDRYLSFEGEEDPAGLARDFACVAHLGTDGCGFEQQLEAMVAALEGQAGPGRPNEGFLRSDSVLGVVIVTDEDDCSAANPSLFDAAADLGEPNLRCTRHPEMLHPIERYSDLLRRIRPDPNRLVVAAIVGVPQDWDGRLASLAELIVEDPSFPGGLRPSCVTDPTNPRVEYAISPLRIAELVGSFGDSGVIHSICLDDWRPALEAITRKLQDRLTGSCLSRRLPLPADPEVCRVVETLVGEDPCPSPADSATRQRLTGYQVDLGLASGRRSCLILPADYDADGAPDDGLDGWYYVRHRDDDPDHQGCPGEVLLTDAAVAAPGSALRIECLTSLCPARQICAMPPGLPCDPEAPSCGPDEACAASEGGSVCVPTVRTRCGGAPEQWLDEPVVFDGCCHPGFHCELDGESRPSCLPNRTTAC